MTMTTDRHQSTKKTSIPVLLYPTQSRHYEPELQRYEACN